jgi:rfaE bifunctional protein nucleotidyltransferase chain/domain
LQAARKLGDALVVAVNSDSSVRKLKQAGRPIVPHNERAEVLSSLESVDYVVIFDEINPERVISEIRPNIHVKGGDYANKKIPESELVKSLGGKTVILDEVEGSSTTLIIERILSKFGGQL